MSYNQHLPQIQDGSTELGFVDSDYPLDACGTDFEASSTVTSSPQDVVDQWLHMGPVMRDSTSLDSFMDENIFDMAAGFMPQVNSDFPGIDFADIGLSAPIIGMDSHPDNIGPSSCPFSIPDLPSVSCEIHQAHASLSGSPEAQSAL
ncbi:hypothetical protein F66182_1393 [Fusarium sp. NRRL 66182]|nr:hypothetical protein F66182_1393 [Fusarium sp. NRRL 66182]